MARSLAIASSQTPATFTTITINDVQPISIQGRLGFSEIVVYTFQHRQITDYLDALFAIHAERLANGAAHLSAAGSRIITASSGTQLCTVTDTDGAETESGNYVLRINEPQLSSGKPNVSLMFHRCTVLRFLLSTDKQVI